MAYPIERSRMNPADHSQLCFLSDGGMWVTGTANAGVFSGVRSITPRTEGKAYLEVTQTLFGDNGTYAGFGPIDLDWTTYNQPGRDRLGASFRLINGRYGYADTRNMDAFFSRGSGGYLGANGPWTTGEADRPITYGLILDIDRGQFYYRNRTGWFADQDPDNNRNGYPCALKQAYFIMGASGANTNCSVNFGQMPFTYGLPAGCVPWQPTVMPETVSLTMTSAKSFWSADNKYGDWNVDTLFPAGPALIVINDGWGDRSAPELYVNGVKAKRYEQINKPYFVYLLPDQGPGGIRSIRYVTNGYWQTLQALVLSPVGLDLSAPTNITQPVFAYDNGSRTDLTLTVPSGGLGLALASNSTSEVGKRNRWLGWTKPLGSVIYDTTQTGLEVSLASLDDTSMLWFNSRAYGGSSVAGMSFAPAAGSTNPTPAPSRRPLRSMQFL